MPRHLARDFLLMFLPIAALVLAGAWQFGISRIDAEVSMRMAAEKTYVDLSLGRLSDDLTTSVRHMASLRQEAPVRQVYQGPVGTDTRPMLDAFISLMLRNPNYDKVRWIDEHGRERVRINNRSGKPQPVPEALLQRKQERYFFSEAMQLEEGEIYVSPLDLNMDFGKIEVPYKPTVRVATRVFDKAGAPRGILIINVAARAMLDAFVNSAGPAADRLMLVNAGGYWLRSPDRNDEYGFMFGRQLTLSSRHPQVWEKISREKHGQAKLADGLWTWRTFSLAQSRGARLSHRIDWKAVSHLPASELALIEQRVWPPRIAGALLLLAIFAFGSLRQVQAKAARAQAEQEAALARNQAAAASRLQEAQAIFRMLFQANTSGLLVVDGTGKIIMANPAFETMFGYSHGEIIGQPVELLVPEHSRYEHVRLRSGYLGNATARNMGAGRDLYGMRKNGHQFPIEVGLSPYQEDGRTFVLATIVDISERKRAQDEILRMNELLEQRVAERTAELQVAKQEAEHLAIVKGNFLANMSHEIRTPMNAILGIAYLLEKAELGHDERSLVHKIRVAGRSLLGIINDILDFSKIESGRLEIEHAPFRLADVLDNVATLMAASVSNDEVELVIGPAPGHVDFLLGDALRLEQVLVNLTSNALKFTERGDVTVTMARVPRQEPEGKEFLRFSVKDTGIGIAADKQAEIFNAFTQEDASTTRRFGGTGLGLSICHRLVALMGGEIGVVSELGKGSEFWFTVPLETIDQKNYIAPDLAHLNVLIADDHPMAREALAATVRSLGWSCEVVSGGQEAVERAVRRLQNNKPLDLLLLDWRMPGMNGLDAAQRIKQAIGDAPVSPIVVMATAHDREALKHAPGAELVNVVLNKPVTASALYNAVAEVRRRMQSPPGAGSCTSGRHGERLRQARILVVDDSEINLEIACRILEAEGAIVHTTHDGQAALDWLREHSGDVDLVLMDVQMPLMDGYEATRHIRETLGLAKLPVVALTAGAFKNQQAAAHAAGMNGFIAKPFDVEQMIGFLQQFIPGGHPDNNIPAAAATPPALTTTAAIDLERGIRNWRDPDIYYRYLGSFAATHGRDGHAIAGLLEHGNAEQARTHAHKLKGASGNLSLMAVSELAARLEQMLAEGGEPGDLPSRLQSALDDAMGEIARLTRPEEHARVPDAATLDLATALPLLHELLQALDRDSPDGAESLLQTLAQKLPAHMWMPICELVDNFDFRTAEEQTKALIKQLGGSN